MSWPELIFYGTIVIGVVGAPFILLYGLYGFVLIAIELGWLRAIIGH